MRILGLLIMCTHVILYAAMRSSKPLVVNHDVGAALTLAKQFGSSMPEAFPKLDALMKKGRMPRRTLVRRRKPRTKIPAAVMETYDALCARDPMKE